jgi:hypothetical protein
MTTNRDLLLRVRAALAQTFTKRGHRAQIVEHEGLGYCSWRTCSPTCLEQRALFLALDELIGDGERPAQPALFEEVAG